MPASSKRPRSVPALGGRAITPHTADSATRFEFLLRRKLADFVNPAGTQKRAHAAALEEASHREAGLLFHKLWSAARIQKYDKQEWRRLQKLLEFLASHLPRERRSRVQETADSTVRPSGRSR